MKKSFLFMFIAVALSGASASLMAQEPRGATATAGTFVMSEFAEKPVKGAPYSAQAITESRQRLADGNEIVNKSEATVYRDTQGRTRREQTLKMIGGLSEAAPLQLITISDPVAGATYTLDPVTKTARKGYFNSFFLSSNGGASPSISVNGGGATAITLNRTEVSGGASGGSFSTASGGRVATTSDDRVGLLRQTLDNVKREDLGTQVIEGVEATGTRNTMTIAAGEIGNERPIDVVTERWYSKELQTTVMSRRSDPRSGETIFRLTNINRNEPAASLFEVPGDYKLTETGGGSMRIKQ